jgi:hypothetical protein
MKEIVNHTQNESKRKAMKEGSNQTYSEVQDWEKIEGINSDGMMEKM